jgi:hypothetical protein
VLLPLGAATAHLGLFAIVIVVAFAVGVYGHIIHSRALIIVSIVVIAAVSLYFVEVGEVATFNK